MYANMMTSVQYIFIVLAIIIFSFGAFLYGRWYSTNKDKLVEKNNQDKKDEDEDDPLYIWAKPTAKKIKIALQMFLGLGLVVLIFAKLFCANNSCQSIPVIKDVALIYKLSGLTALEIVGKALAYASAIELAYTLFTPGPDEVVAPLLMGLSAAILLGIAQIDDLTLPKAGATFLYVLVLAGLFLINEIFIKNNMFAKMLKRRQVRYIRHFTRDTKKLAKESRKRK
jgi:hypothetical protein